MSRTGQPGVRADLYKRILQKKAVMLTQTRQRKIVEIKTKSIELLQISQFVILNRVKDLFLVLQKHILHSVQDDRIRENRLLQGAQYYQ